MSVDLPAEADSSYRAVVNIAQAVERYLRSGDYEIDHLQWPGQNIIEKSRNGHDDHVRALVAEVKKRSKGRTHAPVPELDLSSWTRRKLTPMTMRRAIEGLGLTGPSRQYFQALVGNLTDDSNCQARPWKGLAPNNFFRQSQC